MATRGSSRSPPSDDLEALDRPGSILLLHGAIAAEQLTPRNYPFYQMDGHARILAALDRARPAAVIAATDRTPMAAGLYPFPLFEDGDLGHPSAFLRDVEGAAAARARRASPCGSTSTRYSDASPPSRSSRSKPGADPARGRVVVSAHIDSRYGTPGALDNAGGVCVLMALADQLAGATPALDVELVPFNGEDDFAAPGEIAYLGRPDAALDRIALVVNIDAVGRRGDDTAISFYGCPDEIRSAALSAASAVPRVAEGPEWPMSDHMIFAMRGTPALAVTSTGLHEIAATVAHTSR